MKLRDCSIFNSFFIITDHQTADKSRSDAISRNVTTSKAFHKINKFLDPSEAL
ncbi:hypothetical protein LRI_2047 (plasmid) [Limosilactobacillus reuteri I5007]|uniref:Uncharacterized protein n=1 Tax=Limosilactobacillus reuteri I5007 TaxID=1340495 RepID=R9WK82_LIMRT|nr:hypothetical protein LRI_2047 [Limosilactobacillus reuteri I5007]